MPLRESSVEPGRIYRKVAYGPLLDVFFLDMRSYRGDNSSNDQMEPGPQTTAEVPSDWKTLEIVPMASTVEILKAQSQSKVAMAEEAKKAAEEEAENAPPPLEAIPEEPPPLVEVA